MRKSILVLIASWGLWACSGNDSRMAGGDDLPNGVKPLGKKSAQARQDSTDWNEFKDMPTTSPGMYDSVPVRDSLPDTTRGICIPLPGLPCLPGLPGDTALVRIVDTLTGTVAWIKTATSDSARRVDSVLYSPGGVIRVSIRISYNDSGRWDTYRLTDGDGDGFVTAKSANSRTDVAVRSHFSDGSEVGKGLRVGAGADANFNLGADNPILGHVFARLQGGDTLLSSRLLDADGDGIVIDLTRDTNLVDLVQRYRGWPRDPQVDSLSLQVRLVVYKDSTRNYPLHFAQRAVYRDGATLDVLARGNGVDTLFRPGGEARLIRSLRPVADSLALHRRTFHVRMASQPGAFRNNMLTSYQLSDEYGPGLPTRYFTFDFSCTPQVPDGRWATLGVADAEWSSSSSAFLSFAGDALVDGMRGQLRDLAGRTWLVRFDLSGEIVPNP